MCETGSNLEDETLPLPTSLGFFALTAEGERIQQACAGLEAWLFFFQKRHVTTLENKLLYAFDLPHII